MSSVIKKKSAFMPKAAKRGARKPLETPPSTQDVSASAGLDSSLPILTPPSTQTAEAKDAGSGVTKDPKDTETITATGTTPDPSQKPDENTSETGPETGPETTHKHPAHDSGSTPKAPEKGPNSPKIPQKKSNLSLQGYSIANVLPKSAVEASFDPMSKVPNSAVVSDDENSANDDDLDNEYGDNDIFKHPMTSDARRRSSVANLRRLSGITALRRPSSFSTPPDPNDDSTAQAPVTIGIPVTKPTRKRKASMSLRRKSTRSSIISIPQASGTLREEQEETVAGVATKHAPISNPDGSEPGIVVGLDPITNKMRKFRSSESVVGHEDLPIAPSNLITTITSVKQLPKSIKKEDEHLYASISVEAEQFSMSDLCKPSFKIGEVSEKFQMAEDAKVKIAQRRDERRQARLLARKKGISYEKALSSIQYPEGETESKEPRPGAGAIDLSNAAMNMQSSSSASGVQLQLVNGAIAVDTDSQVVSRGATLGADDRTVEIENPFENPVTSRTYTKSAHTDSWTTNDVIRLYNALSRWGTDFTFIAQLFPYRTRRQIKSKFILEEKNNPQLVELALRRKLPANFESFCGKVSKNYKIKSVEEFNKEMAEIRRNHEAHLEEINNERERAIKEDLETNRKREIEIRAGTKPGSRKDRIRELRKGEVVVGTIEDVKRSRESMENDPS